MCEVVIGDEEQSHVRIVNFTRTHPDQNDYWDGNWLSCKIQVSSGRFWGEVDACLRSDEFDSFLKQLLPVYQSLGGKAEYHSLEDWMTIELAGDGKGHIIVSGNIMDTRCEGNSLKFQFNSDRTSLQRTIRSLNELLARFPTVGKRC